MAKPRRGFDDKSKPHLVPLAKRLLRLTDEWMATNTKLGTDRPASQTDCAAAAKQDDGKWSRWISAESEPGLFVLMDVARFFGVSFSWLATGEGEERPGVADAHGDAMSRAKAAAGALGYAESSILEGEANARKSGDDGDAWRALLHIHAATQVVTTPAANGLPKETVHGRGAAPANAFGPAPEAAEKAAVRRKKVLGGDADNSPAILRDIPPTNADPSTAR